MPCCPILVVVKEDNRALPLPEPLLLKLDEARIVMRISRSELYRKLDAGEIRSIYIGPRQRRIPMEECRAYVRRKLGEQAPGDAA